MRLLAAFADIPPVPWANGAGETTELVSLADSRRLTPGLPAWRLSVARLETTGPFSSLPDMDRTFLPVGAEVTLEIDGIARQVPQTRPIRFGGDQDVRLISLPAPCFALNLMVARTDDAIAAGPELTLAGPLRQAGRELFAVTLGETPQHSRFEVIHLGADERLPSDLRVAYVH